jgi:hypothetical protein
MSLEDTMHVLALVGLAVALAVVLKFLSMLQRTPGVSFAARLALLGNDAGVVTLADANLGALSDIDLNVINEFRKSSYIIGNLPFDDSVNPAGGGSTLVYGYTRAITQANAAFRAINAEYTPAEVTRQQFTTALKPLGGSFQVDRVLANVGPAASTEVAVQIGAIINATRAKFSDAVINGDTAVDANGFDGLSKALTGSVTEIGTATNANGVDWSTALDSNALTFKALEQLDNALALMDGPPTVLMANKAVINRLVAAARATNAYTENVLSFAGGGGTGGTVRQYGNLVLLDPGTKAGANTDIIPLTNKTVGTNTKNFSDVYAVRFGLDGFHGVSVANQQLVKTYMPALDLPGAVKTGEVEMGPVSVALKATRAAAVLRNVFVA